MFNSKRIVLWLVTLLVTLTTAEMLMAKELRRKTALDRYIAEPDDS